MKNEKLVTFACFVGNRLIEKVWFVRHVTANAQHMAESFIRNYRQLVFALDVVRTCYMVTKKAAYRDWETDRKSTRLNSSHSAKSRMPSSA